jgi:hypothetical protein
LPAGRRERCDERILGATGVQPQRIDLAPAALADRCHRGNWSMI